LTIARSACGPAEGEPWQGIRLATPERATLDILRDTRLRPSLPRTVAWADALVRDGFVDATAFSVFLSGRHDHGVVRARKVWALVDPRSDSVPESELRVWLRLSGLVPRLQADVRGFRLGLCFPDNKLSVELEREWNGNLEQARQDAWRRRRLRAHGWESVIVPHRQFEADPKSSVEMVRTALHRHSTAVAA
jgi:very-short-patch-repair endonuclease